MQWDNSTYSVGIDMNSGQKGLHDLPDLVILHIKCFEKLGIDTSSRGFLNLDICAFGELRAHLSKAENQKCKNSIIQKTIIQPICVMRIGKHSASSYALYLEIPSESSLPYTFNSLLDYNIN